MDKYNIDSHKLHLHVQRVSDWLAGGDAFPIYMEISPSGACNHRCVFCGLDFMGYKPRFLDTDLLKDRLAELGRLGLKSVMYAGEGEPFLHKNMVEIIGHTKKSGIDVALTTNSVLLKKEIVAEVLAHTSWIKVSCNGGTAETYSRIHRTKPDDFDKVFENLGQAVTIRKQTGGSCTLGLQCLLLPENQGEIVDLARKCRDSGLDYLVVKPYSQHPQGESRAYEDISYQDQEELGRQLALLNNDEFNVVFRHQAMRKWDAKAKPYKKCMALPFWSYIDAGGNVWGCSVYLGDDRFLYGNIYEKSFEEIWQGSKRQESLRWVRDHLDPANCRVNCRMDPINTYLWELKNLPPHVNFI